MSFPHRDSPTLLDALLERLEADDDARLLVPAFGEERAAQERVWARLVQDIESLHVAERKAAEIDAMALTSPSQGAERSGSAPTFEIPGETVEQAWKRIDAHWRDYLTEAQQ